MKVKISLNRLTLALSLATAVSSLPSTFPRYVENDLTKLITRESVGLQDIVTWDKHSIFIRGERLAVWSGEVHPWRLPVPGLWLDVFQKIKALGYNTVSFYTHWGLMEYKRGEFKTDEFLALEPFFDAATKAGIYLIARPGPYINAETMGGGFPGWGVEVPGPWRSFNKTYVDAYTPYVNMIGKKIADAQITKGGPVIMLQVENELVMGVPGIEWPQIHYMQDLVDKFRALGVVVPTTNNDAWPAGWHAPGSGIGEMDFYAHDGYPNGFNCKQPYNWNPTGLPTGWHDDHMRISPNTPYAILEFQGGAIDDWGGAGFDNCATLTNNEMVSVFYKNNIGQGVKIFNVYMTFGGTNWGGIAGPPVYTSYDYGSAIKETREITREKYNELKLQAGFIMSSPAYLTSVPTDDPKNGTWTDNSQLWVTRVADSKSKSSFWVLRKTEYTSTSTLEYKLKVPTSQGEVSIPQLGKKKLSLNGRDSKIHLTDYKIGSHEILYSSAEIFTWKTFGDVTVAIFYGKQGEIHETAFKVKKGAKFTSLEGEKSIKESSNKDGLLILNYETTGQSVVSIDSSLLVYFVDKSTAYKFSVVNLIENGSAFSTKSSVIVKGPYLIRSAEVKGSVLELKGDLNATAPIEVFAPQKVKSITWNGKNAPTTKTNKGTWTASLPFAAPKIELPKLSELSWKYADSLREIRSNYNDKDWTVADKTKTLNARQPTTPTILYAGEYGYHTGSLLWRGHFVATGAENSFNVTVRGGVSFAFAAYIDEEFIGHHAGDTQVLFDALEPAGRATKQFNFPAKFQKGSKHVITIVQDHMGVGGAWTAGSNEFQIPIGIWDYNFNALSENVKTPITWKLTGNLGGEDYVDRVRGPVNEGGFYAERQGWHLPGFDTSKWRSITPTKNGVDHAGIGFFVTEFDLNLPKGYDIPLAFDFKNTTAPADFRALLYVNGYQFGKYVNNLGPQTSFPVPEGIINHRGHNTLALLVWSLEPKGVKIAGLDLVAKGAYQTSYGEVKAPPQPKWTQRKNAY